MPRTFERSTRIGQIILVVSVALLIMTATLLYQIYGEAKTSQDAANSAKAARAAVETLRKSAIRNECRSRITLENNDQFQHDVGILLDASLNKNDKREAAAAAHRIATALAAQQRITKECPAPLVKGSDKAKKT